MAREKMFDPAFQKSFTEAIHKENKIRNQWHLEHGARLKRGTASCDWDDEPDDDDEDFTQRTEEREESLPGEPAKRHQSPKAKEDPWLTEVTEKTKKKPPKVMKRVPVETKKLLYKGSSRNGEGRSNYLKSRYQKSPESKFYFPICSSWEYGWTYGQTKELKCPQYGRRQIMKTSFFRPNDPQLKPRD